MPNQDVGSMHLPSKPINKEFMEGLEVLDAEVYPLPGGYCQRQGDVDTRLKHFTPKYSDILCYLEHVATIRHKPTGLYFVAFRKTIDALMMEQQGDEFPLWLMGHPVKKTELSTHIYLVKQPPTGQERNQEDWLVPIPDHLEGLYDTVAYFLLTQGVIAQEAYGKPR